MIELCCFHTVQSDFNNVKLILSVLDKRYSWEQASKSCILLGSNNLGEVQIQKINISKDIPGELYWIGAIDQSIWFEYLGKYIYIYIY